jgi:DNA-binding CsgD family transcriptional regulator
MSRFNSADRSAFLTLKGICYRGLDRTSLLAQLNDRIGAHLRADATCMVQLDPATGLPTFAVGQGWPEDAHEILIRHALLASPTADPGYLVRRRLRSVVTETLVPEGVPYHRDPYFEYHILWGGYRHEVQTACAAGGRAQALLTVSRRGGAGSFEPRHLRLLDALAPHVAAGMQAAVAREALAAAPSSDIGVIALDERDIVVLANPAAEPWLTERAVGPYAGRPWGVQLLARLLRYSLSGEGAEDVPTLDLPHPVTGALHSLRAERAKASDGRGQTLVLIEPSRPPTRSESLYRLGLSPREAEVAVGILRGASTAELARGMGISPHTVLAYRRNLFSKLDVSSRRELMARLYRGF